MPRILVTNDDGVDSPTLVPLARALAELGPVRVVVPAVERSWVGKAISRFGTVATAETARDGLAITTVSGTPADAASLGVHGVSELPPELVVSGINLGLNYGTSFVLSSGTIGAAAEAAIGGVPAVAVSMQIPGDAYGLSGAERAERIAGHVTAAVAVTVELVTALWAHGFPPGVDCFSINLPADVGPASPRRLTHVTRARYGPLFRADAPAVWRHRFQWYRAEADDPAGDIAVVEAGGIAIAPLRFAFDAAVPASLRLALER